MNDTHAIVLTKNLQRIVGFKEDSHGAKDLKANLAAFQAHQYLLSASHFVDQADCTVTVNPSDGEVQLELASRALDCFSRNLPKVTVNNWEIISACIWVFPKIMVPPNHPF